MGKRPRIKRQEELIEPKTEIVSTTSVEDFIQNCASPNAKFIHKYTDFEIEIWIDKHYEKRSVDGDENGKRLGIDLEPVIKLIIDSVKYIFHFYMVLRLSNLINFFNKEKPTKHRIIVKDFRGAEDPLNIVIEVHFLDYSKYEITIITAMKCQDFKISDGQIFMSITAEGVNLNRMVQTKITSIDKIPH
ncbi:MULTISPECIES: hypothetical protein [Chryseobacterium]|uniref:hypothetical protein n=1 Tax=Chryseobacterium TaxID=59732 RepID=UPI000E27B146|nr:MULTISPECIES: hypothetical protein [Chryseobacterium]REC39989.1 hypothetical protein DRF69_20595 [Chryseobacterium sp. 5_R23647]